MINYLGVLPSIAVWIEFFKQLRQIISTKKSGQYIPSNGSRNKLLAELLVRATKVSKHMAPRPTYFTM